MGPGWTITGLSAIARCNPTYAQDGTPAPITLSAADGLCLDGNRLRGNPIGSSVYQTEIANFSLVTASGTAGAGPSFFTVQGKDGLTYEYGNTTDSRILPPGATTPYIWALDKVTDHAGNHMTFTYFQQGGAYVPLSIQYTALSGSTSFPYQVNFVYTTKSSNDTLSAFVAGSQVQKTEQLSTITVTSSGTTVREYKLSYTTSTSTLRATLTSIQECGGSAGSDCLSATAIGYQNGTAGVASPITAASSGATNGTVYSADVDGDGQKDLVFQTSSGQWWVQLATASGFGTPISTGAVTTGTTNFLLDDFDGKGGTEILAPVSGVWCAYKLNGTSFTATSTGVTVVSGALYSSADVDGDGLPDLVDLTPFTIGGSVPAGTANIGIQLNTSNGAISFVPAPVMHNVSMISGSATGYLNLQLFGNNQLQNSSIKHFDFDGDGRQDLLIYFTGSAFINNKISFYPFVTPLLSRGTSAPTLGTGTFSTITASVNFGIANWNDDACTDLYLNTSVEISPCNGSLGTLLALPAIPTLALDWDGDGRTDLLANVSGTWQLYRSEGNAVAPAVSTGISVGSGKYAVTDKNGDGLDDLVFANAGASNAIYYGLHNGADIKPDLATSFVDGYNNRASPTFAPLTQSSLYTNYTDAIAGYKNYIGPLYVVNQTTFSDPSNMPSGTYNQQYSYYGAWTNVQGRGFTGFEQVQRYDSRNALWENFFNDVKFPYVGMLDAHEVTQDQARTKNITYSWINRVSTQLDSTPNNQRYFVYINHSTLQNYEVGGAKDAQLVTTTATSYTFDNYGNATDVSRTVTDNDTTSPTYSDTWTSEVVNTVTPNTTQWCLNLPTQTTVTNSSSAPGGAAITRTIAYNSPDYLNCRETEKVTEPSSALYRVTEDYTYDPATGNLTQQTVTGVNMAARSTHISWSPTAQFPVTVTNPLPQSITLGFDPSTGFLTSVSDLNSTTANPLATSWTYDNFGRQTLETRLDGTSTARAYDNCTTAGCVNANNKLTVTQTAKNFGGSTLTTQNVYLDSLDRPLVGSALMINNAFDRQEIQYDNLGNVHKVGAPSTFTAGTLYWTTYGYDALNRVTSAQRPTSAMDSTPVITQYSYQGRTSTITDPPVTADPFGRVTTKITLPSGLLARTKDYSGYSVNFGYDAFGSLLTVVDSSTPANTLLSASYAYGIEAFQVSSTDADLGKWTRVYDALGELTSYQDAKTQNFSFLYDALSRPTRRTEPDLTTIWNWGTSAALFNLGQLASVTATSTPGTYSETYGYDSKTRLSTTTIAVPGDTSYTFTQTYNATTGLLDTLKYPVSTASYQLKLQYSYTNGILQHITDITPGGPGSTYWVANSMNPRGQILQETLGNGVIVNHAFDAVNSFVQNIQAGFGGGSAFQNNTYLFDVVGNLTQRQDNNIPAVTENVFPDSLYRVDHTVGDTNTQFTYDSIGRISSWALNGGPAVPKDYTTPQPGCTYYPDHAQPHAVRKATIGGNAQGFCYDANGNLTLITYPGVSSVNIAWTSFNKLNSASNSANSSQFFYGADHQRYKQLASYGGVVENTIYVGGLLEKMSNSSGTAYRHYIPAGNNTIVYTRSSTGTNSTYYLTKDHLGSSAVITDQNGTSLVKEKFSAMGFNENSAPEQALIAGVSRHGFSGHEGLATFFWVNMDGRVYVPNGGMFISADPYVPDPTDTQSFNRYGYASNNPLSRVDPTGFDDNDTVVVNGFVDGVQYLGEGVEGIFSAVSNFLHSLFGGGGGHSTPQQQKYSNAGLLNAQSLQGAPSAANYSDGQFRITLSDTVSGTQGPQVTPLTEITVTSAYTGGGGLTTPPPELALVIEPPTAIHDFGVQISQNLSEIAAGQGQSATYASDIASTPSYWSLVGQGMARSGPKALNAGLIAASLIPIVDIGADAVLAGGATKIIASNGSRISGFTGHGINRAIGDAASRAGTKPQAILDALRNPTKIVGGVDRQGRPFQIFTGGNARVVVNPETGQIVSVNPLSALGAQ
jgi:RHS repeat-associated protein